MDERGSNDLSIQDDGLHVLTLYTTPCPQALEGLGLEYKSGPTLGLNTVSLSLSNTGPICHHLFMFMLGTPPPPPLLPSKVRWPHVTSKLPG